jgi:hypothetical protein
LEFDAMFGYGQFIWVSQMNVSGGARWSWYHWNGQSAQCKLDFRRVRCTCQYRQYVPLKRWSTSTWLHSATSQKTLNFNTFHVFFYRAEDFYTIRLV